MSLSEQTENDKYPILIDTDNPPDSVFEKIYANYFSVNKKLINAFKNKTPLDKEALCSDYENVVDDYKNFIENNPDSPSARKAIVYITRCLRKIDNLHEDVNATGMRNFLTDIKENKKYPALVPAAERLMIDYCITVNDYTGAIETSNNLIEKYKSDDDYVCDVLYNKGLILLHNLRNPAEAEESFKTIVKNYPENPIANLAEKQLQDLGYNKDQIELEKASASGAKEFTISNSPNPFNPVTTIKYNLPEDVNVTLEVFNVRGQKIKTLVNRFQKVGNYDVQFDGTNLASGVYIYKIKAGNYSMSKRMLLIK